MCSGWSTEVAPMGGSGGKSRRCGDCKSNKTLENLVFLLHASSLEIDALGSKASVIILI
jgi:hypothetical protein